MPEERIIIDEKYKGLIPLLSRIGKFEYIFKFKVWYEIITGIYYPRILEDEKALEFLQEIKKEAKNLIKEIDKTTKVLKKIIPRKNYNIHTYFCINCGHAFNHFVGVNIAEGTYASGCPKCNEVEAILNRGKYEHFDKLASWTGEK
jgi:predicted Zn-ribbon and HTH transcriptional regulator